MAAQIKARASEGGGSRLGSAIKTVKSFYNDPFRWTFIKSWTTFAVGVWIATEMKGLEIMGPPPPA